MPLKIAAVTGSRADWGLLSCPLSALRDDPAFDLKLIVTGQHLMAGSGDTSRAITESGFSIDAAVDMQLGMEDDAVAVTQALGRAISGFAPVLASFDPDLLLVLGDRYEILGAVQAALIAGIPVAHICGGDITEGAIDDAIRHAITKMAHLHFVTNRDARDRVIQMGENPDHVYCLGSPGLDQIHHVKQMSREEFFESVSFTPRQHNVLVTFHPVTLEENSEQQCQEMLAALDSLGPETGLIFTGSNADPQGSRLTRLMQDFADQRENACFYASLGAQRYFNALRHCDAMVGNSSSGLYEAPSFGLPVINIGDRQKGRLKTRLAIDCPPEKSAIAQAIETALRKGRSVVENPYGDGHTSVRIVAILKQIENAAALRKKIFFKGQPA